MKNNNSLEKEINEFVKQSNDMFKELMNNMVSDDKFELDDDELDVIRLYLKLMMSEHIMIESAKYIDKINEKLDTLLKIPKA